MINYLCKTIYEENEDAMEKVVKSYEFQYKTSAKARPRGDYFILQSEYEYEYPIIVEGEDGLEIAEDTKKPRLDELYKVMVDDIYNEMENVFNTRNDVSASATAATWEAMEKRPKNYLNENLGLLTEQNVLDYAETQLEAADAYGKYRLERINKYNQDKGAILNEDS